MPTPSTPRVSVAVRSMNRLEALFELLERLLAQEYDDFEIVVVEQTRERPPAQQARLDGFAADPRVRILDRPPLGGPGARNEAVSAARGDIVILVDDDDLPISSDWIAGHAAAFRDPLLVGITGRHVRSEDEQGHPFWPLPRWFLRRRCMSYSFLRTPYVFARYDEDVDGVGWLHGTNSSFRREAALRAGLWDTSVRSQDEHSFAFKLQRVLRPGEYLGFRTHPPLLRRLDIPGGMNKRRASLRSQIDINLQYVHRVVGRYFPARMRLFYPLYLAWSLSRTLDWVWNASREAGSLSQRVRDFAAIPVVFPVAWWNEIRGAR